MTTKEKILAAAVRLFNEQGTDMITFRHIARDLDISHSNIQYYFKNSEEIISALYKQHLDILNTLSFFNGSAQPQLDSLRLSIHAILEQVYHYRFIYIHLVSIARKIPSIRKDYNQRFSLRRKELLLAFGYFREKGLFRNDIPAEIWENLIRTIYLTGDFWISANELKDHMAIELKNSSSNGTVTDQYAAQIYSLLYPFLTAEGRLRY